MKKILSVLLALCLLCGSVFLCGAAENAVRTVPENVRKLDGWFELIGLGFKALDLRMIYPQCQKQAPLYSLEEGYVPQGFCYIDSASLFAVTYYHAEKNSILILSDAATGERVKTVHLFYADGSPCNAHCGGVTDIGDSLLISSGKSLRRLKLADLEAAEDFGIVRYSGTLKTHMQASFAGSYGNLLFVGQYYTFRPDGSYNSPDEHHLYTPGGRNYAMCEVCDLSDLDAAFAAGEATPMAMISLPNCVQGIAYDGQSLFLSTSAMTIGSSHLDKYAFRFGTPEGVFNLNGNDVPLYYVIRSERTAHKALPPMLEGIDLFGTDVAGIFESGATKFSSARLRISHICTLGRYA